MARIGMEAFMDLWQGNVWPLVCQDSQQGAADQGDVGQQVGIAAAGAVFPHEYIASPVITDFHAAPVATNQRQPLAGTVFFRSGAGKIIVGLGGGQPRLFDRPLIMLNNQSARKGEVRRQRFDGEGMEPTEVNSSVVRLQIGKKGVSWSASRPWACLKRPGWLPLIWRR